jgi:hypothetical protein
MISYNILMMYNYILQLIKIGRVYVKKSSGARKNNRYRP